MTPQEVKYIVVHCAATLATQDIGAKEIDRWHREKGWLMVGYHFVIRRDGTVEKGRPTNMAGAHEPQANRSSIGICMVGGANKQGRGEDNFTPEQYRALRELIVKLRAVEFPNTEVLGHRDFPGVAKDCPSFDVRRWWAQQETNA